MYPADFDCIATYLISSHTCRENAKWLFAQPAGYDAPGLDEFRFWEAGHVPEISDASFGSEPVHVKQNADAPVGCFLYKHIEDVPTWL